MFDRSKGWVSALAALALAATLVGCTDADEIATGNYSLTIAAEAVTSSTTFDCVTIDFGAIRVQPADPAAAEALGVTTSINYLSSALNFVPVGETALCDQSLLQDLPTIPLPSGEYVFTEFRISQISLFQDGFPIDCFGFNYTDNAPSPVFTIGPTQANTVRFAIDLEALADDAINTFCTEFLFNPLDFVALESI